MPLVQVIIDRTTSMAIEGVYDFQRGDGGTLIAPAGSSFPGTPVAGEWFWRTDESKLYRRNDTNSTWVAVVSAVVAHAATHKSGGLTDEIKLDELAAPTDITTLNADLTKHGLLPKLGGGTTNYLRADGTWATPPGGGGTDPDAIHDNVSGEIAAITAKTIPAIDDLVIIEDSAASNAKKKMTVGSLLAGERNYFLGEASFFDDFWPPVLDDQWSTAVSGTGSLVALQTLPGGQVLIRAGNAAGRTAELYFGGSTAWQSLTLNPRIKARMKYGGNNNGHIEFEVHYQDANNHVWMEADWGGNWLLKTMSGGVSTTVDTGVALDTSWHIFEVRTSPTSVSAYIDEVLKGTSTTNIPSSNGTVSIYISATGTGGVKDLLVDGFNYAGSRPT